MPTPLVPAQYFRGDELPYYTRPVTIDGVAPDLTTGWTFTLTLTLHGATVLTKTTGITGDADGGLTVAWATGDLDTPPGIHGLQVTALRTADSREWTFDDLLTIKPRSKAEA